MATLFLVRHAEPELTGVFLGRIDSPLKEPSQILALPEVAIVYTSPLQRARQTAPADAHELDDLREVDYGEWTGETWTEIELQWPELAARKAADWLGIAAPGGEEWSNVLMRAERVLDVVRAGPLPAALVAHQGINAAIAHLIRGDDPLAFNQQYGEVISVELD